MKATWHRASGAFLDADSRAETIGLFWNYDLGSWSFGFRFEHDPMWYDFMLDLGPLSLSAIYWRVMETEPAGNDGHS